MAVLKLDLEHGIGKRLDDRPLQLYCVFSLRHKQSLSAIQEHQQHSNAE